MRDLMISPVPAIAPSQAAGEAMARPLFSVMVPVYNSTEFMAETLTSVLAQDPGPEAMQIDVLDNCSTRGAPDRIVAALGAGRIGYHRRSNNIGAIENFNECIRRARGEWVHILHADDAVRPGFYQRARDVIAANPEVSVIAFRTTYIDPRGICTGFSELEAAEPMVLPPDFAWRQLTAQRFQFVALLVRRAAYEELGGFRRELPHCADWDMWSRLALAKRIFFEPQPLACYRQHPGADSAAVFRTGANVREERLAIRMAARAYVPAEQALGLERQAMRQAAARAARRAHGFIRDGEWRAAWRQIGEALQCCPAPGMVARLTYQVGLAMMIRAGVWFAADSGAT